MTPNVRVPMLSLEDLERIVRTASPEAEVVQVLDVHRWGDFQVRVLTRDGGPVSAAGVEAISAALRERAPSVFSFEVLTAEAT